MLVEMGTTFDPAALGFNFSVLSIIIVEDYDWDYDNT
jgi:hypothetical protein